MRTNIVVMEARQWPQSTEFLQFAVKLTGGNHGLVG